VCAYIDGGIATATPYGPCGVLTNLSPSAIAQNSSQLLTLWVGNCGDNGCITVDSHFYVRDIQIWTCSTPWKGPCTGPVIQSNNDGPGHIFAWVDDLYNKIKNAILPAAHADWFNPPYSGFDWNRPPRSYGSTGSNSAHDCVGGDSARRNRRLCSDWPMMAWGSF